MVLVGYSDVLRGVCSHESADEASSMVSGPSHSDADHCDGNECHCFCHQSFLDEGTVNPLRTTRLSVVSLVSERAERPPETIRLGIDYPPQQA